MSLQYSVAVRNARLEAVESTTGTSAILQVRTGNPPANCAAAASGTLLSQIQLPSDWMANAANGTKAMSGTWEQTSAAATGTAGHFRIYDSSTTTCHMQGTITASGGGGDMTVDNTSFAQGQDFLVTSFTLTSGNA